MFEMGNNMMFLFIRYILVIYFVYFNKKRCYICFLSYKIIVCILYIYLVKRFGIENYLNNNL